jgi:DNA-binding PadR family transcriptional regulator
MDATEQTQLERVLRAIGTDRLSGFEALARLDCTDRTAAGREAFLYPTLHRLEASGRLGGCWEANSLGNRRRLYARRSRLRLW